MCRSMLTRDNGMVTQAQPEPPRSRGNPSLGDMLRSVVVMGVVIAAIAVFTAFLRDEPDEATAPVDYRTIAEQARDAVSFKLVAPGSLPDGWWSNNARITAERPIGWHLGVVTVSDDYIGLEQSAKPTAVMIEQYAKDTLPDGSVNVDRERWSVRTGDAGEMAYVRREAGSTVLVSGDAPRTEIESYLSSLSAV